MYYATVYPIQNYTLLFPVGQDSGFYPEIAGYNRIELSPSPHFGDVLSPVWWPDSPRLTFPGRNFGGSEKMAKRPALKWLHVKMGYNTMVSYIMESTSRISDHNIP